MKKFLSNSLMILAILHIVTAFLTLFHVGTGNLDNLTCDRLFAFCFIIGCFYGYVSLRMENEIVNK